MNKKHKLVSLFCGAGGMDLGFIQAGFKVIWANDFDHDSIETYKRNLGNHVVLGDITKIKSSEIPDHPDVIIGGFPCQGFSIANNGRNMNDSRNFLYKEMLRIIKDKKPKIFVAENVKGLLSMEHGAIIKMIQKDFEKIGYTVEYKVLNAADYGVPQYRERVIIMGNRVGIKNLFPDTTHAAPRSLFNNHKPHIAAKTIIGFLSNVPLSYNPVNVKGKLYYNHMGHTNVHNKFYAKKHPIKQEKICDYLKYWRKKSGISTKKIDEIFGYKHTAGHWFRKDNKSGSIPQPDDWTRLKEILNFDDKYDRVVTELELREIIFEQSLRITNWNRPSDTITASGPEIHVNKKRRLSARECAMLQTFPDDFIFEGSLSSVYRQVGNAVPVQLAYKIAQSTLKILKKEA